MSRNLGLSMADSAVTAVKALNKAAPSRTWEIYKAILEAQEKNKDTANAQGKRALPHGISSVVSIGLSMVGQVFKDANNPIGDVLINIGRTSPDVANLCSSLSDKTITVYSHATRAAETQTQRKTQEENNIDSSIARIVEQTERFLSKEA